MLFEYFTLKGTFRKKRITSEGKQKYEEIIHGNCSKISAKFSFEKAAEHVSPKSCNLKQDSAKQLSKFMSASEIKSFILLSEINLFFIIVQFIKKL